MSGDLEIILNEGRCLIGYEQKNSQFICDKKFTAPKILILYGLLNGDKKLFLALIRAIKQEYVSFSIITLIYKFKNSTLTPKDALLFVI